MARNDLARTTPWITAAAMRHGDDLAAHLTQRLGFTRRKALALLRQLVAAQWLVPEGPVRRPRYRPGALRQVVQTYPLAGLQEDMPWRHDFAPFFDLPPEVSRMARHAFTELVNNAIDHSGGTRVTVSMRSTPLHLQMLVSDDGCGLFARIAQSFSIDDPQLAMFELSKGKLSSQPERHSGHGLYFSARLADVFDVHANGSAFQRRGWGGPAWRATRWAPHTGTSVYLSIALDTPRTLDAVLRQAGEGDGPRAYAFDRTQVPLALLGLAAPGGDVSLTSRAEARRVAQRLARFSRAEIDFSGVQDIGHAFADELFRVVRREQPALDLLPMGMNARVRGVLAAVAA
jgi:anti-sigma regulatory factor (Ser/Thr protein kinase)